MKHTKNKSSYAGVFEVAYGSSLTRLKHFIDELDERYRSVALTRSGTKGFLIYLYVDGVTSQRGSLAREIAAAIEQHSRTRIIRYSLGRIVGGR